MSTFKEPHTAHNPDGTPVEHGHSTGRIETGVVRFGDDWPGVFIRGDEAAGHGANLRELISDLESRGDVNAPRLPELEELAEELEACREPLKRPPQQLRSAELCRGTSKSGYDAIAMREMSEWMARSPARYVHIVPEIQSCQRPYPPDVLSRTGRGEGLFWTVEVGVRNGKRPFASNITARTIAEAWTAAIENLREAVR